MTSARDVAKVFLKLSEPETGDLLTNLKIQKLVYYVQGFHLALEGAPIFGENILHWDHGPVVRELYDEYKALGYKPIPVPDGIDTSMFSKRQLSLIEEVNSVYGQFSAWKLRDMTHNESPWMSTSKDEIISHDSLKDYFRTLVA